MAERMLGQDGELTLEDFLEQMMMVKRMGPIGNMLGMLPGMGQMKDAISQIDDRDLDRVAAIIRSMTPAERQDPKILNGSRRLRIARGVRRDGHRRQPAGRPVRRGPQDDEADGRHARACPACAGPTKKGKKGKGAQGRARAAGQQAAAGAPAAARRCPGCRPGSRCRRA